MPFALIIAKARSDQATETKATMNRSEGEFLLLQTRPHGPTCGRPARTCSRSEEGASGETWGLAPLSAWQPLLLRPPPSPWQARRENKVVRTSDWTSPGESGAALLPMTRAEPRQSRGHRQAPPRPPGLVPLLLPSPADSGPRARPPGRPTWRGGAAGRPGAGGSLPAAGCPAPRPRRWQPAWCARQRRPSQLRPHSI